MEVRYKIWLEENGDQVFGEGLFLLLARTQQTGSLHRAALDMNMSYRYAWGKIKKAEKRLGRKLLTTQTGGEGGGGARLTPLAEDLVNRYRAFNKEVQASILRLFADFWEENCLPG